MSYGEDYFRSLNRNSSLRHSPTWIANYPAQKPVIDAQKHSDFCAMPGHCECLRLGHKRDRHAFECVRSGRYNACWRWV